MSDIPPKGFLCKKRYKNYGVTEAIATLGVGESVSVDKRFWSCVTAISRRLGIKTATRSLGSEDTVTIYRNE